MNGFGHLYMWVFLAMAIIAIALILLSELVIKLIKDYRLDKWERVDDEKDYDDYDNE